MTVRIGEEKTSKEMIREGKAKKKKKKKQFDIKYNNNIYIVIVCILLFIVINNSKNSSVLANSLTNNRVLYIDNTGKLATTDTEPNTLSKINNIESNITTIQQQLDGKQGTVTGSDGITVNSNNNITINKNELLNIIKTDLLNIIYPVGAIYISIDSTSPATLFGGSWTKIDDGYYLRASAGGGGEILGEQLPNITGSIYLPHPINAFGSQNGAFTGSIENSGNYLNYGSSNQPGRRFTFKASNSNSIYTDNGVVRPKSIKVYMWKRTN